MIEILIALIVVVPMSFIATMAVKKWLCAYNDDYIDDEDYIINDFYMFKGSRDEDSW